MALPSSTMEELLQTAANIKTEQLKKKRRVFESWPDFVRNTLFHEPAVRHLRDLPFAQRLNEASKLKDAGNTQFKRGRFAEAHGCYERALGVMRYVHNDDPTWYSEKRGEGKGYVDDDDVRIVDWRGPGSSSAAEGGLSIERGDDFDAERVQTLKYECAINLAQAMFREAQHRPCVEACTYALTLRSRSAKALYRRAMAHAASKPSSGEDRDATIELAQRDFARCLEIDPRNRPAREAYHALRRDVATLRAADRSTFRGFLNRGDIGVGGGGGGSASAAGVRHADAGGRAPARAAAADAAARDTPIVPLAAAAAAAAATHSENNGDENCVTEEVRRAVQAKFGIDLHDPAVVAAIKAQDAIERAAASGGGAAGEAARLGCCGERWARLRRWEHFHTSVGMVASACFVAVRMGALGWTARALWALPSRLLGGGGDGDGDAGDDHEYL